MNYVASMIIIITLHSIFSFYFLWKLQKEKRHLTLIVDQNDFIQSFKKRVKPNILFLIIFFIVIYYSKEIYHSENIFKLALASITINVIELQLRANLIKKLQKIKM